MKKGLSSVYSPNVDILSPVCGDGVVVGRRGRKLFVLGGRRSAPGWLHEFVRLNDLDVWAVDSGVAVCRAAGLRPSVIVGDQDSATSADWEWAVLVGAEEHLHNPDKNRTDFQLALELLHNNKKDELPILTGCFGGRMDHFLSILRTFCQASKRAEMSQRPCCMIDHEEGFLFLHGEESAELLFKRRPVAVSLLSMSKRCSGVSISGVRWPLLDVALRRNFPWSISNETMDDGEPVAVSCGGGLLGVSWCYFG